MPRNWQRAGVFSARLIAATALLCAVGFGPAIARAQTSASATSSAETQQRPKPGHYVSALPRGTKLILKNGTYELASEYNIQGDRVRYYSVDRAEWEVIPTAIVDWDATKKQEAEEEKSQSALLTKAQKQEDEHNAVPTLDVDASLEVAPAIFLPPADGLFEFDGKSVVQMPQAETDSQTSKTRVLARVLVPVPIVPSRQVISILGEHAKFRLNTGQPEFYLRTSDERTPDVELIRAKVHHGKRQIANLDSMLGNQSTTEDSLPLQQWVIAKGVYRYTLGQKLAPGEYVFAQILPNEGMSLYVWDFGVN